MLPFLILILGVTFGSLSALVYKSAAVAEARRLPMLAVERLTVISLLGIYACFGGGYVFVPQVLIVSIIAGLAIASARLLLLSAMRLGPAGLSWTIINLSVSVPVVFSITRGEHPTAWQVTGLLLTPVCIMLMCQGNGTTAQSIRRGWILCITATFILDGVFSTCFKLVKEMELESSRHMFLLLLNCVAFTVVATSTLVRRRLPRRTELKRGLLSGLCIGLSAIFWVEAIMMLPGIVFFPSATILGIIIILILMRVVWQEKLGRRQLYGAVLAIAAILMIALW